METHWKAALMAALMFLLITFLSVGCTVAHTFQQPAVNGRHTGISTQSVEVLSLMNKITNICPDVKPSTALEIAASVYRYSKKHDIPADFILTIIYTESRFRPAVMGRARDTGLMQVVPKYHRHRLRRLGIALSELKEIDPNIKVGCDILAEAKSGRPNTHRTLWLMAKCYNGRSSYANIVMYRYRKLFGS